MPRDYSQPIAKFKAQAGEARRRGIGWELTFEEWLDIWQSSGKWEMRGIHAGQYVMARKGDVGPYSRDNIYICLASENHSDAHKNGRIKARPKKPIRPKRVVRGWTYRKGAKSPYQVMVGDRYIGIYRTQEEAEAAYVLAWNQLCKPADGGEVRADESGFSGLDLHGLKHAHPSRATPHNVHAEG